jgi:hypothetical protein
MRSMSPRRHWRGVGMMAVKMNCTLEQALTKNSIVVDTWIAEGFKLQMKRQQRRARQEAADAAEKPETLDLICEKAGL